MKKLVGVRWIACLGFLALAACGGDGSGAERASDEARYDASVERALAKTKVPGLAVARLEGCRTSRVTTYGVVDIATEAPVTETTAMEAASLSKPVFAHLVMQLIDEGLVDLDERVADTIEWPRIRDRDAYERLTPRLLLSHQSGLPNWSGDSGDPDRTDVLRFAFRPGEKFRYSGEGYTLLQAFAEAKSGRDLESLFRERLGARMPLSTFGPELPDGVQPAFGHGGGGGKKNGRPIGNPVEPAAPFSLRTVINDYAAFAESLCNGRGMSGFTFSSFAAPEVEVVRKKGGTISWALGIGRQDLRGRVTLFHWGDNEQFKAFVAVVPQTGEGVVFFANGKNGLKLIETVAEPAVGRLDPTVAWLGYGKP